MRHQVQAPCTPGAWCLAKARDTNVLIISTCNMGKKGAFWELTRGALNLGVAKEGFLGFIMKGMSLQKLFFKVLFLKNKKI